MLFILFFTGFWNGLVKLWDPKICLCTAVTLLHSMDTLPLQAMQIKHDVGKVVGREEEKRRKPLSTLPVVGGFF